MLTRRNFRERGTVVHCESIEGCRAEFGLEEGMRRSMGTRCFDSWWGKKSVVYRKRLRSSLSRPCRVGEELEKVLHLNLRK